MTVNEQFHDHGFAIVEGVLNHTVVDEVTQAIQQSLVHSGTGYRLRHLTKTVPEVFHITESTAVRHLVEPVLGPDAFIVQSLFFDKTPDANWNVAWHQDLMVPVETKVDDPNFGPWSLKDGVWHVQPPAAMLEEILTVRLHLDDCFNDNGPLRVLPGSHKAGILTGDQIDEQRTRISPITCSVARGGALLMRPLLLHASSRAKSPEHRRVIHLEFAAKPLSGGLKWADC